jgi:[amino group carrier protein]-L-2-aminoadipate 6-kinase
LVVVFKIGDRAMADAFSNSSLKDLEQVYRTNQTVIVHGGGDTVTQIAQQLDIPQKFITSPEGIKSRYTDEETIEVYTMVMGGKINKKIVRDLQRTGIPSVGISGLDAGILHASRKTRIISREPDGRRRVVEGGYTGRIERVDQTFLQTILSEKYLPVIAPIALGADYEPLNIDGDRAAAQIAGALKADTLVLLTDVDHVKTDDGPVFHWTLYEAKQNLPNIGSGMNTKIDAAITALSQGVGRVVIAPAQNDSPYSKALTGESGTVIS